MAPTPPVETPYQVMPELSGEEYAELRADIAARGVMVPIECDEHGNILDGYHRMRICRELGIKNYPTIIRPNLSEAEKRAHARKLNLLRRHLDGKQRRALIRSQIEDTPEASSNAIAEQLGVSPHTVIDERNQVEAETDVCNTQTSVDRLGRVQPRQHKPRKAKARPDPKPRGIFTTTEAETKRAITGLAQIDVENLPDGVIVVKDPAFREEVRKARPPAEEKPVPAILPTDVELYCDDARSISLYVSAADLILTSPPYGLEKDYPEWEDDPEKWAEFMGDWLCQAYAVARDGGRLALNIPLDTTRGGFRPTYAQAVTAAIGVGWTYRASIVWNEGNITHSTGRGSVDSPNSPHVIAPVEMVALFGKGEWDRKRQGEGSGLVHADWLEWTNGLWTFPGESRPWEGHPAAFPEQLPHRLITLLSFPGDLVVDPFCGSGTTLVAAKKLNRPAIGIDCSPAYIDATRRRLDAMR